MWLKRDLCVFEKSLLTISNWQQLTALQLQTRVQTKKDVNRGKEGRRNNSGFLLLLGYTYKTETKEKTIKKKIEGEK